MSSRTILLSFDCPLNRDYGLLLRRLRGLAAIERIVPKTTYKLTVRSGVKLNKVARIIKECLDPWRGSAFASIARAARADRTYTIDNRSNNPNRWVELGRD